MRNNEVNNIIYKKGLNNLSFAEIFSLLNYPGNGRYILKENISLLFIEKEYNNAKSLENSLKEGNNLLSKLLKLYFPSSEYSKMRERVENLALNSSSSVSKVLDALFLLISTDHFRKSLNNFSFKNSIESIINFSFNEAYNGELKVLDVMNFIELEVSEIDKNKGLGSFLNSMYGKSLYLALVVEVLLTSDSLSKDKKFMKEEALINALESIASFLAKRNKTFDYYFKDLFLREKFAFSMMAYLITKSPSKAMYSPFELNIGRKSYPIKRIKKRLNKIKSI